MLSYATDADGKRCVAVLPSENIDGVNPVPLYSLVFTKDFGGVVFKHFP